MKKLLAMLLAGLMILVCFVGCGKDDEQSEGGADTTASANVPVYNGFTYTDDAEGEGSYVITGYQFEKAEVLTIPSTINDRPVSGIGAGAFKANRMTGVVIPEGVTHIESTAFYGCDNLTSITLPSTLKTIGEGAFNGCTKLTSITLPEGVTAVANYTFMNCTALTTVTLPTTVTSIGAGAFLCCTSLSSIQIPEGLTAIGDAAFADCAALAELALPAGLTAEHIGAGIVSDYPNNVAVPAIVLVVTSGSDAETYAIENELNYRVAP